MKIEDIVITRHAFNQFRKRHEALTGVKLSDPEIEKQVHDLITQSKPEEESQILETRREVNNDTGEFYVAPPWRIVCVGEVVVTCEIAPEEIFVVKNPQVPASDTKARFVIKIKKRRLTTKITNLFNGKTRTLSLWNSIEIDAIIRALRALGFEVNRLVEKPTQLEIGMPQNITPFRLEQLGKPDVLLIYLGVTDSLPLGRYKVSCSSINRIDLENILKFLQEQANKPH